MVERRKYEIQMNEIFKNAYSVLLSHHVRDEKIFPIVRKLLILVTLPVTMAKPEMTFSTVTTNITK